MKLFFRGIFIIFIILTIFIGYATTEETVLLTLLFAQLYVTKLGHHPLEEKSAVDRFSYPNAEFAHSTETFHPILPRTLPPFPTRRQPARQIHAPTAGCSSVSGLTWTRAVRSAPSFT